MECGKKYLIIYDDKGIKPVKKFGVIIAIDGNLFTLDNGEILNTLNIIRAIPQIVEGGKYEGRKNH